MELWLLYVLPHCLLLFETEIADRYIKYIILRETTESLVYKRKYTYLCIICFVETETGLSEQIIKKNSFLYFFLFLFFLSFACAHQRFTTD